MQSTAVVDYQRTPEEQQALDNAFAARVGNVRVKVDPTNPLDQVTEDHPDRLLGAVTLMRSIGTQDLDFYIGLLNQLASVGLRGQQMDEIRLNFMLSVIKGIEPRDQIETMLAAQM